MPTPKRRISGVVLGLPPAQVARLHRGRIGVKLAKLSKKQAEYLCVPVEGPYKPEHYRY
jgi:S-adenosylhomocysteine hydrolase